MIFKHLLPIGLFLTIASGFLPTMAVANRPTPPRLQSLTPIPSILLVFQIQRSPGTTASQNMKTTIQVFQRRLAAINHGDATITAIASNRLSVKIPGYLEGRAGGESIARSLMTSSKLIFSEQKIGTEEVLRELLREREKIKGIIGELYTRSAAEQLYGEAIRESKKRLSKTNAKILRLFKPSGISGRNVIDAQVESMDTTTPTPYYSLAVKFNAAGSERFTTLTKKLAGTGRSIGIFVDDELSSYPMVDAQYVATGISGGSAVISGAFSKAEADSLALSLNSGQLPAPIKLLNINSSTGS